MKISSQKKQIIIQEIFYFLSILLISLFSLEIVFSGMINNYFNLNFLLIFWLIFAFLEIALPKNEK